MAEQNMSKPRQPRNAGVPPPAPPICAPKVAGRSAPKALEGAVERLEASTQDLKRERDVLAAELAAAKAEIARLEVARQEAVNRIDWVINNLNSALQEKS